MAIAENLSLLVGNTPLFEPRSYMKIRGCKSRLFLKLEAQNPSGSSKDRAALLIIKSAIKSGELSPSGCVIVPTSGNMGISFAAITASLGIGCIIVLPEFTSPIKLALISSYGAKTVKTPSALGMSGAVRAARELKNKIPGSLLIDQFTNELSLTAHYMTTGPEIARDICEQKGSPVPTALVAGVGSAGTLCGTGKYLRERFPKIDIVAVEPRESPVLLGGKPSPHKIEGIGANFVPPLFDRALCSEIIPVGAEDALSECAFLARHEGLFVGPSSGAALSAALSLSQRERHASGAIVVILPDSGNRYISDDIFGKE